MERLESPSSQHALFLRMQDGAQIKYPHPLEMVSIKFQRVKKQKSIRHSTYVRPLPWGLTLIAA
jgi:hypothetical protein